MTMFELGSGSGRSCDGVSRRDVLRVGSLAALGLGLPGLLRAEASAKSADKAARSGDVSCILVWLQGGISHIDSFDPKPEAPAEIRGDFGVIDTNVPGIRVTEHLGKLARHQDKFSILRSLNPRNGSHGVADAYMMSGHPFSQALTYPSFGAVVAREKGDRESMPPYIQIGTNVDQRFGGGVAGFLGDQYNPFVLPGDASSPGFKVRDVSLPGGIDRARFDRRRRVLAAVDTWQAKMESSPGALDATGTGGTRSARGACSPADWSSRASGSSPSPTAAGTPTRTTSPRSRASSCRGSTGRSRRSCRTSRIAAGWTRRSWS